MKDSCEDAKWSMEDRLRAFEDVEGQPFVVKKLSARVREGSVHQPIVFHGPDGVGKTALAWLYAQALLCLKPKPSGSPCLQCDICEAMAQRNFLYCFSFDAARDEAATIVKSVVDRVGFTLFVGDKSVVIIANADRALRTAFDQVLKLLERETTTIILFLATDLMNMAGNIKSRCERLAIAPLSPANAMKRLITICDREGVTYEAEALDVISMAARHRAGSLLAELWRVVSAGPVTLARAREVLDLDWTERARQGWLTLLDDNEDAAVERFVSLGRNTQKTVERMRAYIEWLDMLLHLGSAAADVALDPAFVHASVVPGREILLLLEARASVLGSREEQWRSILSFWSDCDAREEVGLGVTLRQFARLMAPRL